MISIYKEFKTKGNFIMKRKMNKKLIWLIISCLILTALPMTVFAAGDAPMVISGQETQAGNAAPASNDTLTPAVSYTADMTGWFEDTESDALSYSVVSAVDASSNDVSSDVTISGSSITYVPAAAQASQDITIVVNANDGASDSTSNVTITVSVDAVPADINNAPTVVPGQEVQADNATPASNDTITPAVPYTADMSGWFEDTESDALSYSVVSAVDASLNDVSADITISGSSITYIPAAAQASQNVTIIVNANDGTSDSITNVTITVSVGAVPADQYTLTIGGQSAGGAGFTRDIVINDNSGSGLNGKYLVIQYTSGTGENAKVSVVMIPLNDSSTTNTVSYQTSDTAIDAWLTNGMPDLTAADMGVTVYANANTN